MVFNMSTKCNFYSNLPKLAQPITKYRLHLDSKPKWMQRPTITSFTHLYFSETVNAEFMTSVSYKMSLTANLVQKGLGKCCHFFSSATAVLNALLPATHYACPVCVCVCAARMCDTRHTIHKLSTPFWCLLHCNFMWEWFWWAFYAHEATQHMCASNTVAVLNALLIAHHAYSSIWQGLQFFALLGFSINLPSYDNLSANMKYIIVTSFVAILTGLATCLWISHSVI
jgi:hypothetical protein